ncbi:anthranilate synthase component I [Sporosarcina sp. G11-34]|uniref:anthranilate synthase component I n=1 Tax=Sporosarcina sp. G11-34 TaxID=2849605 RepID=UPI0022A95981|nr:anthranilate synthase component I [Sporosarcina sp. G11-34]MCZ2259079.1 anthranilate synthase component I [Sporosarcina sp. G11-34]
MKNENTGLRTMMKKLDGDSLTPILIFRRMKGKQKFLLESSSMHEGSGRYSFMGMDPRKSYSGSGNKLEEYVFSTGKTYTHEGDLVVLLKRLMPRIMDNVDFPFTGGAVGYFGYGVAHHSDESPVDEVGLPDVHFNVYETIIVYDHVLHEVTLLRTAIDAEPKVGDLDELAEQILSSSEGDNTSYALSDFVSSTTQPEFEGLVLRAKEYIEAGEVFQVVVSRRLEADFEGDPFSLYRKLRKRNPSPYMYYMDFGDHTVVGASPESLVCVSDGKVMTNPIAGTRRRGKDRAEDLALEKELLADPKELSEHEMLVELGESDMKKVCVPGSIEITKHMEVVRYQHVMHIVSEVEGELSHSTHALDALTACLPAGTVTGSPKQRAMEIIDELEDVHRGIYGGAIGYLGFNGNMDFALTIRTLLIKNKKAYVQAGAGVVAGSVPKLEYKETVNKARSLLELI